MQRFATRPRRAPAGLGMLQDGGIFPLANAYLPAETGDQDVGIPERIPAEILAAQVEDDTVGSGIFSDHNNLHTRDGIFADRASVPGYLAREPGTGPSEVIDWQTGTPIMSLADGLRTGSVENAWTTTPPWPNVSGASFPNVLSLADQVDFRMPRVPVSNEWAAQQAQPQQPVFEPSTLPYPAIPPGTWGTSGSAGTSFTAPGARHYVDPNLPVGHPARHPDSAPTVAPALPFKAWQGYLDNRPSLDPNRAGQMARPARMTSDLGTSQRLPDPSVLALAQMQPQRAAVLATSATTNLANQQRNPQAQSYAQPMLTRKYGDGNVYGSGVTPRKPQLSASGLGALGELGGISLPGGDIGKMVMWGFLGGITLVLVASALDVDIVKEAKDLIE